jgi:hypothetical protein
VHTANLQTSILNQKGCTGKIMGVVKAVEEKGGEENKEKESMEELVEGEDGKEMEVNLGEKGKGKREEVEKIEGKKNMEREEEEDRGLRG